MRRITVPIELSEGAKIPEYKTELSAGADLSCVIDNETQSVLLHPNQKWLFNTGVKLQLPPNAEAQIRPRSGISLKRGLVAVLGTIDADYRGEIKIVLHNVSKKEQLITHGDRLAQIVFNGAGGLFQADFKVVEKIDNDTQRGENGFGHTGIN
ncbi:MAG: dUTP diphosphatase [Bacteroidales bacterium]|nr:dUTP diphosphatase [Bacteroidales bacterium]